MGLPYLLCRSSVFPASVDYPDMADLLDTGLEPGVFHCYVSNSFLNGFLPYLKPVRVVLLERYRNGEFSYPFQASITDAEVELVLQKHHTCFGDFEDDVVFVGETKAHWWVLHCDCDVSDCCIGRVLKTEVTQEQLMTWVDQYAAPDDSWKVRSEIPADRIHGWVQF